MEQSWQLPLHLLPRSIRYLQIAGGIARFNKMFALRKIFACHCLRTGRGADAVVLARGDGRGGLPSLYGPRAIPYRLRIAAQCAVELCFGLGQRGERLLNGADFVIGITGCRELTDHLIERHPRGFVLLPCFIKNLLES